MFLRTTKAGGHEYVQLAHNTRDPETGRPVANVLFSFGRKDTLDVVSLRRLIDSIKRYLPEYRDQKEGSAKDVELPNIKFIGSLDFGCSFLLDAMWSKLGIGQAIRKSAKGRKYDIDVERLVFSMVLNRASEPTSKLAMEKWVGRHVHIDELEQVNSQQLYRAMDYLIECQDEIQKTVFWSTSNLLNLDVDLVYFDTTSTYFETEDEDGFRMLGYSKDKRPDLPQVVIGFAVTKEGIPVRCWTWPGNTSDQDIVAKIRKDLRDWNINRVIHVLDTGFNSKDNRKLLTKNGDGYIIGEKLHPGRSKLGAKALSSPGKFKTLENGLEIKEVELDGRKFVVIKNPVEARRDALKREDIVKEVKDRLEQLGPQDDPTHKKNACKLRAHRTYGKYIRQSKTGKLFIDMEKIHIEERFDGKYLISSSETDLPGEELVNGYKQLWRIERIFRTLKHTIDLRPVRHRLKERIEAHVVLCWLAILLIRVAELKTGKNWSEIEDNLRLVKVGKLLCENNEIWQVNQINDYVDGVLKAIELPRPSEFIKFPSFLANDTS